MIDDESVNPAKDSGSAKEAVSEGEGRAKLPLHLLYDKIDRPGILTHAYQLANANGGAPGVDGQTFQEIEEESGREEWFNALGKQLREKRDQPQLVRSVITPKPEEASVPWESRPFGTGWRRPR